MEKLSSHSSSRILSAVCTEFTTLLCLLTCAQLAASSPASTRYAIVIDAGSSGSRIYVFTWEVTMGDAPGTLPQINEMFRHKIKPGISHFAGDSPGLRDHVVSLVKSCKSAVPEGQHAGTPIYLMATGGMRLLLEEKATTIFQEIDSLLKDRDLNPFFYVKSNSRILSGEEEGAFAWIAVNYLRGFFSRKAYESVGILEMGGASMQIAFIPESNILAFKFPVRIAGRRYGLYVHSYLYYGQETMDARVRKTLYMRQENRNKTVIENPCMLTDDTYTDTETIPGLALQFKGHGDSTACLELLNMYLNKVPTGRCYPKPCAIGPNYQPDVGSKKPFYALSGYVKNIAPRGVLDTHSRFTPADLERASARYCNLTLDEARNETGRTDNFLSVECMMGLYIPRLLTHSFGFSKTNKRITVSDRIGNREAQWVLGAVLYELEKQDRSCVLPGTLASTSGACSLHHMSWNHMTSLTLIVIYWLCFQFSSKSILA